MGGGIHKLNDGLVIGKVSDDGILNDLDSVKQAGKRIEKQIGEILDYSEIDRKRLVNNCENYTLFSVLHDLVSELRTDLKSDIELIIDVETTLPSLTEIGQNKLRRVANLTR